MRVLLLGKRPVLEPGEELSIDGVDFAIGSSLEELHAAFAAGAIDHVIIGGGLDLDVRLELVRAVFEHSNATTVHLKDRASGPQGYLPFVGSVIRGLSSL